MKLRKRVTGSAYWYSSVWLTFTISFSVCVILVDVGAANVAVEAGA